MTADVFISYSREDKDRVTELANKLRDAGISLWIDQGGIDGAAMWSEEIVHALEDSKVLMLMVTEKSMNSHNVVKEVTIVSEKKGHILPIHLEPTLIPATLKYPLAGIQHVEYFQGDKSANLESILRALSRLGVELRQADPPVAVAASIATSHSVDSHEDFASFGNTIAVLPFENMSPDKDSDYFSDGLTDELITNLSKIAELQVISRILSQPYKGTKKDPRTIGRELHARYFVAGGVRRVQNNLRISAQLIDIASGRELWAEKYKGTMEDVFDIQENVSSQIADALKVKLSPSEKAVLGERPTTVLGAYDLFLRARHGLLETRSSTENSIALLEKAISLDPRFAEAYAGAASAYTTLYQYYDRQEKYLDKAMDYAVRALMHNNQLGSAFGALSYIYVVRHELDQALITAERAVQLAPDDSQSYSNLARAEYASGKFGDALQHWQKATTLTPKNYLLYDLMSLAAEKIGDAAILEFSRRRALEILPEYILTNPDEPRARMSFATSLAIAGRMEEARAAGLTTTQKWPNDPTIQYYAACLYSRIGDLELAMAAIRTSIANGWGDFDWIKKDPDLDLIRNHPGYIELMKDK